MTTPTPPISRTNSSSQVAETWQQALSETTQKTHTVFHPSSSPSRPPPERQGSKSFLKGSLEGLTNLTTTLSSFAIESSTSTSSRRSTVGETRTRSNTHNRASSLSSADLRKHASKSSQPRLSASDSYLSGVESKKFIELASNDFPVMSTQEIRDLPKAERLALKSRLTKFKTNLEIPNASVASSESSNSNSGSIIERRSLAAQTKDQEKQARIQQTLTCISHVQESTRCEHLIASLLDNNSPVRTLLSLSPESVIKIELLFTHILNEVCPRGDIEATAIISSNLLSFCLEWTKDNQRTQLFEKALPLLRNIQDGTKNHSLNEIREKSKELHTLLNTPVAAQKPACLPKGAPEDFILLLTNMRDGGNSELKHAIQAMSRDLFQHQVMLLNLLTPHDLVADKWPGKQSPILRLHTDFTDKLEAYIRCLMLQEPQEAAKIRIISFFYQVAEASLELFDYGSAFIIFMAFNHSSLDKLPLWKHLGAASEIRQKLLNLFNPPFTQIKSACEKHAEAKVFHIPLISMLLNRVTGADGACPPLSADEECYNFGKIQQMKEKIDEAMLIKTFALPKKIQLANMPTTNLIEHYLQLFDLAKAPDPHTIIGSK